MKKTKVLSIIGALAIIAAFSGCSSGGSSSLSTSNETTMATTTPPTKATTEAITEKPTEAPTTAESTAEKPTEKPTEKPEKASIINNTSSGNFAANGSGDYVAEGLKVTQYAVLHIEYNGSGNFSVISYEGDDYDELLVNTIGNYSGDVLITHSGNFNLEINAKGNWSITSSGLAIDDVTSFSGTGDTVTGITTHSGGNWKITHNGGGNFSVVEYGMAKGYMDLLVNEIGDYSGTVKAESGDNVFFQINAEGAWTMERQ